jgi:hypothetical protein
MASKKIINQGLQIGTQNNQGGEVNNAARDIIINKKTTGASLHEFVSLLDKINSQIESSRLPVSDKQDLEAIIKQVLKQSQKEQPQKSLIVEPLKTAFELITQASGAATAIGTISQLIQHAIQFAQKHF